MFAFNSLRPSDQGLGRHNLLQALLLVLLAASSLTLAPRPVAAQAPLTCVNTITANGLGGRYPCVKAGQMPAQTNHVTGTAHLAVADAQATAGVSTTLTVTISTEGNAIAAATFVLSLDPAMLHFTDTDADEDGVPDAISLHVPPSMTQSVTWNTALHRLEVAVFGMSMPLPTLTDGVFAAVQVQVAADATASTMPLTLDLISLSDLDGNDLPVTQANGTLTIEPKATPRTDVFLPLITR